MDTPIPTKILLVDDDADIRSMLKAYLRRYSLPVEETDKAEDGIEIITTALAARCPHRAIITDNNTQSKKTGIELTQLVRIAGYQGPIILLSADLTDKDKQHGTGLYAHINRIEPSQHPTYLLPKPFERNLLTDALVAEGIIPKP